MAQDKQNRGSKGTRQGTKQGTKQPTDQGKAEGKVQGEGDYAAARRYDEKLRDHVRNHDIEQEARDAEPGSQGEEREMEHAEEIGRRRAKGEDPLLEHPENMDDDADQAKSEPSGGQKPR